MPLPLAACDSPLPTSTRRPGNTTPDSRPGAQRVFGPRCGGCRGVGRSGAAWYGADDGTVAVHHYRSAVVPDRQGEPDSRVYVALSGPISTLSRRPRSWTLKAKPAEPLRQPGGETQALAVTAQPAEAGDQGHPGARQGRDVQPVAGVVLQVGQVHQRGLGRVVVGQSQMVGLGGDHRLAAGREGGVADGQRLVVGEVAGDLLLVEVVRAGVHRQDQVGLLDDLFAVEVEVGEVEQQGVLVGAGAA